jgi:hypothetical protein
MESVCDPIEMLSRVEATEFARMVARDTNGRIQVLNNSQGYLVLRYTKEFSLKELRIDPPHLIATKDGRLLVAKKMNKELFVLRCDEEDVLLHPTTELNGASLMRAIGAPTFEVVRGQQYEYLEFIAGIDLMSAKRNGFLAQIAEDTDSLKKMLYAVGIALAQAYIIGTGDRFGGIRVNLKRLDECSINSVLSSEEGICCNIDLSSALDGRVFSRGIANFLNVFCAWVPPFFADPDNFMVLREEILKGFIIGYERARFNFESNRGPATDLIRMFGNGKDKEVFSNLELGREEIQKGIQRHTSKNLIP